MKTLDLVQGSPEWLAVRAKHFCASDAPAMMGVSKYQTRNELIHQMATGDTKPVDSFTQARFDRGHETEAQARAILEEMLGEELYPVVGVQDALLASFDGLTMDGTTGYEHKLWNEELAAAVRAKELPPAYFWQLEHQILVGDLEKVIFVCSDGTRENMVHMEYRPVPGRREQLLDGWFQFKADLDAYKPPEFIPAAVAKPVADLPAVLVQVNGSIAIQSNLALFGEQLIKFVDGINRNPEDDQAFADAEKAVKVLGDAEAALKTAEEQALAQTASIDDMRRTVAGYIEIARTTRLALEKAVKNQKDVIRGQILQDGKEAFTAHIDSLNKRLGKPYMPTVAVDFAGAMKGKRTIESLRNAVDTELARAKIDANAIADKIQVNLNTLRELASDHAHLFADTAQIVLKPNDDLTTLVKLRIAEAKAKEEKRIEQERERIRAEEAAKLVAQAAQAAKATVVPPAVAPPAPEVTKPAPAATTKPASVVPLKAAPSRPTDDQIIDALCDHFRVHESTVIKWLLDVDLKAASDRMVKEFTAA